MPYTISDDFKAHLAAGTKTLTACFRVVRQDGTVFAFTKHTRDITLPELTVGSITIPETTYYARPGCVPTDLQESDDLKADNFSVSGVLGAYVTDADVRGGRFRSAEWSLIFCNYNDTTQQTLRKRGWIADAQVDGIKFTFSCKSLSAAWETEIIEATSPVCRYKRLGVSPCPFDMTGVTTDDLPARITTTVASVTSQREIVLTDSAMGANGSPVLVSAYPSGRFTKGLIVWNDGLNAGLEPMDIQEHKTGRAVEMVFRMPFLISPGDSVTLDVGCDRRFLTCGSDGLFDVAYAFGGEPDSPTVEQISANHL